MIAQVFCSLSLDEKATFGGRSHFAPYRPIRLSGKQELESVCCRYLSSVSSSVPLMGRCCSLDETAAVTALKLTLLSAHL